MDNILQIFSLTIPVFSILILGMVLRRMHVIDYSFVTTASALVFKITLPATIALALLKADLDASFNLKLVLYFCFASLLTFAISWIVAIYTVERKDRGVYIQGSFRGNNATIGFALALAMYGDIGLSIGAVLSMFVVIIYNTLSVISLSFYSDGNSNPKIMIKNIITNPMVITALVAISIAYCHIQLPSWMLTTLQYTADMTLPLAVICIGASLSISSIREASINALSAAVMKTIVLPVIATAGAIFLQFKGPELAILFLYFASPSATVSFVMAKAFKANEQLAAAIIAITSFMVIITNNIGLLLLKYSGLI